MYAVCIHRYMNQHVTHWSLVSSAIIEGAWQCIIPGRISQLTSKL